MLSLNFLLNSTKCRDESFLKEAILPKSLMTGWACAFRADSLWPLALLYSLTLVILFLNFGWQFPRKNFKCRIFFSTKRHKKAPELPPGLLSLLSRLPWRSLSRVKNAGPSCQPNHQTHARAQQHLHLPTAERLQLYLQNPQVQTLAMAPGLEISTVGLHGKADVHGGVQSPDLVRRQRYDDK